MLQVKNRSNTENSSSKKVREKTSIELWYRVNANDGAYNWEKLNELTGCPEVNEENFSQFVRETIKNNPSTIYVEDDGYWNE